MQQLFYMYKRAGKNAFQPILVMNSTKHVHVKNTGSGFVKTSTAKYSMNTERLVCAFCDHKENLMVVLFTFPYRGDLDNFHGLSLKNIYIVRGQT